METNNYNGCLNPDEVRSRFIELARNGADIASASAEMLKVLESMRGHKFTAKKLTGESYQYNYVPEGDSESRLAAVVAQLIGLPNISLLMRGSWLWIEGDTKSHKDILKTLGCRFNARRTAETKNGVWNWTATKRRYFGKSRMSYSDIRAKYGEERI